MGRISEVVKNLIGINIILFLAISLFGRLGLERFFWLSYPDGFLPVQIFSHMFLHANPMHLFSNMLMLFFLGPSVEQYLGPKKFLLMYFVAGIGALIVHFLIVPGPYLLVGASGAVYGVMAVFGFLFPNRTLMLIFPPIPIKAKYLITALIAMDLYSGVLGTQPGIANFAHLGGALFGVLIILYWRKFGK